MNKNYLSIEGNRNSIKVVVLELVNRGYSFQFCSFSNGVSFQIGYVDVEELKKSLNGLGLTFKIVENE